ncbi:MAG TPA: DUF1501 domain-containing protein [Pirellulales bacterium]|jgi:hypothetical protein|nr:DUF1501 domain-containing protein [Pirellulales bacterium]
MWTERALPSRRDVLRASGGGFGAVALAALFGSRSEAGVETQIIKPRAKSVIWCFIDGGPSHLDLFDPKPALTKFAGAPLPASFTRPVTAMGVTADTPLLASRRTFARHGQSGTWVSDWLPEIATCVDDMAVVRSCTADGLNHVRSVLQMNTGSLLAGRPSLGSWCVYGLGSECENLPGFVVLQDYATEPPGGYHNWSAGFMPGSYQGTRLRAGKSPILHLAPPPGMTPDLQRAKLDYLAQLNASHRVGREDDDRLEARIASGELAFRMQATAPEAVDIEGETQETRDLYGVDDPETAVNGRNCLRARRLVERGVRFVQLYFGSGSKWDAHKDVENNHSRYCRESDRPIAALVKDLKARGLLDSTLVVWGGEFGRTPMSESGNGRDHNPYGFTMWMAGGGVRGGMTYGATDDVGLYAVENKVHVRDIHATILHLLGLDHRELTFEHNGREERLTDVAGEVITGILA